LEKSCRCLAPLSNDQLVRLGSILVVMAERLAESVDRDVDGSLEGTKRLEREFSRVRRTRNDNDRNDRFQGKITHVLNRDLDSPVAEPKVTDPVRHSPVGGAVLRAIDLDISPLEARKIADDFMTGGDPSRVTGILHYNGEQFDARGGQVGASKPLVQAEAYFLACCVMAVRPHRRTSIRRRSPTRLETKTNRRTRTRR
jgi:hypothetical protein